MNTQKKKTIEDTDKLAIYKTRREESGEIKTDSRSWTSILENYEQVHFSLSHSICGCCNGSLNPLRWIPWVIPCFPLLFCVRCLTHAFHCPQGMSVHLCGYLIAVDTSALFSLSPHWQFESQTPKQLPWWTRLLLSSEKTEKCLLTYGIHLDTRATIGLLGALFETLTWGMPFYLPYSSQSPSRTLPPKIWIKLEFYVPT